jgi:hypothetical protein
MLDKKKSAYKTIIGLLFGLTLLFLLKRYEALPYVILSMAFLTLIFPKFSLFTDTILKKVIHFAGNLLSTVILIVFFYFILSPFSLLSKIFHKTDSLKLKKPEETNFKNSNKYFDKESFKKLW